MLVVQDSCFLHFIVQGEREKESYYVIILSCTLHAVHHYILVVYNSCREFGAMKNKIVKASLETKKVVICYKLVI